jgi:hypothetical protein
MGPLEDEWELERRIFCAESRLSNKPKQKARRRARDCHDAFMQVRRGRNPMFMAGAIPAKTPVITSHLAPSHLHGILQRHAMRHVSPRDGCSDQTVHPQDRKRFEIRRVTMWKKSSFVGASIAFAALASASLLTAPAQAAVVYCKTAGVPQGCVVRPAPIVAPVRVAAVSAARVGYYRGPVAVRHVGYTRVGPYGVRHVGYTRVWR